MAVLQNTGGASALPSFDAPAWLAGFQARQVDAIEAFDAHAWLADWTDNGGVVIVAGDRLIVSRLASVDRQAHARLNYLRGLMLRQHGGNALLGALVACSNVEG